MAEEPPALIFDVGKDNCTANDASATGVAGATTTSPAGPSAISDESCVSSVSADRRSEDFKVKGRTERYKEGELVHVMQGKTLHPAHLLECRAGEKALIKWVFRGDEEEVDASTITTDELRPRRQRAAAKAPSETVQSLAFPKTDCKAAANLLSAAAMPLVRRGMHGELVNDEAGRPNERWHQICVRNVLEPPSNADPDFFVDISYVNQKGHTREVSRDELRGLDCGATPKVYVGMNTFCRFPDKASDVKGLGLPSYLPGKIVSVVDDKLEFDFFGNSPLKIMAKYTDLLYVGVPTSATLLESDTSDGEGEGKEVELNTGCRKRSAPKLFDPTPRSLKSSKPEQLHKKKRKIVDDESEGGSDDDQDNESFDEDLFPRSDDEKDAAPSASAMASNAPSECNGDNNAAPPPAGSSKWGAAPAANNGGGWGSAAAASRGSSGWEDSPSPSLGRPSSGWGAKTNSLAIAPAANIGWGSGSAAAVSQESAGWGNPAAPTSVRPSSGWGTKTNARTQSTGSWGSGGWGVGISSPSAPGFCSGGSVVTPSPGSASILQHRMPTARSQRTTSKYAVECAGVLPVLRDNTRDQFYLWFKFRDRLLVKDVNVSTTDKLEKEITVGGRKHILIARKFINSSESAPSVYSVCDKMAGAHVKAFYLLGDKDSYGWRDAQRELDAIANFSELALNPGKLASRLELFVSPATHHGITKKPFIFELPLSLFEEIDAPENQTMGCGFISPKLLEELLGGGCLGNGINAEDAVTVQVRVVSPHLGVFKGMLVKKVGIEKRIQLPSSMKKLDKAAKRRKKPPSKTPKVFLEFIGIAPSTNHAMMERTINPNITKPPTKSSSKDLKALQETFVKVLVGCGVPGNVMEDYQNHAKSWDTHKHSSLIGVCDCTGGGLPEGHVFIPGLTDYDKVIVTRFPCTEKNDVKVLPVVSKKPKRMTTREWEHLCSMAFGVIMFPSPKDLHAKSLVEQVNNSDLDGDYFCVLWDATIVKFVEEGCKETGEVAKVEEESDDDSVVGSFVPIDVDGKMKNAKIKCKTEDGMYVVRCGPREEVMSREDIFKDREIIDKILDHKGKGHKAELKVLWGNGVETWERLSELKKEVPGDVAQYAQDSNLLDLPGWKWARDYIGEKPIVEMKRHRFKGKTGVEVEVRYDGDGTTEWIDAKESDMLETMASYVQEKDISLDSVRWKWLKDAIGERKKHWFSCVQECLANVKRVREHDRFMKRLFTMFRKRVDKNDPDSIVLSRAYKISLEVLKHGGLVPLPARLQQEVTAKASSYMNKFMKLDEDYI